MKQAEVNKAPKLQLNEDNKAYLSVSKNINKAT